MTIEEMEKAWMDLSSRIESLEKKELEHRAGGFIRRRTSLDNLALRYRQFCILGFAMIIPGILLFFNHDADLRWWLTCYYSAYMALAGTMDLWLYKKISSIDIAAMPVAEVSRLCRLCRRRHHQFMIVLIPMALGFVSMFCFAFRFERYMMLGCLMGFVLGLIIGLFQYFKFMSDYNNVIDD